MLNSVPGIQLLYRNSFDYQTYWGYTIFVENRDKVKSVLAENGVASSQIHVRNDHYSMFKSERRSLPNTDWIDLRELSIPCGWWVSEEQQYRIIEIVAEAVQ